MTLPMSTAPVGVMVGVLSLVMAAHPALVQTQLGLVAQLAAQGTGLGDLLADPGQWATTVFNAALVGLGEKATSDVVGALGWVLGNGNLISQTPSGLSYESEAVQRLWGAMVQVADGGLAVVTVWGGVNLITRATDTFFRRLTPCPCVGYRAGETRLVIVATAGFRSALSTPTGLRWTNRDDSPAICV